MSSGTSKKSIQNLERSDGRFYDPEITLDLVNCYYEIKPNKYIIDFFNPKDLRGFQFFNAL